MILDSRRRWLLYKDPKFSLAAAEDGCPKLYLGMLLAEMVELHMNRVGCGLPGFTQ